MCVREVGAHVVTASTDSTVRVWDKATLEHVKTLRGHRGAVLALACVGPYVLSGGRDNAIRVWDMEALCCRRTLVRERRANVVHDESLIINSVHGVTS